MKILVAYFTGEGTFKPTIRNEGLHQDRREDGVILTNFAALENLVVESSMLPHRNTSTSGPLLMGRLTTILITC
jgi:hypothetical protein